MLDKRVEAYLSVRVAAIAVDDCKLGTALLVGWDGEAAATARVELVGLRGLEVAVGRDTECDLVGGHTCGSPRCDGGVGVGSRLFRGLAAIAEGSVRTWSLGRSPNVVVHEQDPVKDLGKARHVGQWLTVVAVEGPDLGSGGDERALGNGGTEFTAEDEEVVGVITGDGVACGSHGSWVLPVQVDTIELELFDSCDNVVDESLAGVRRPDERRKVGRTSPATD